ncbi:MAG: hypothetical protein ACOZB0_07670 [Pseudomonadota bacterium]
MRSQFILCVALCVAGIGSGFADSRGKTPTTVPTVVKVAAWERVGESTVPARVTADPTAKASPTRKSDMVRRMFWIMLAHN